ncbi:hypothetical protein FRC20_007924 [Serendipita sp. 405]|nr:hypothetical protein FRC20_007924 [Serendipita sp. 405]
MEDLGVLPTLDNTILQNKLQYNAHFGSQEVATALGRGLGVLHALQVDQDTKDALRNPNSDDVVFELAVKGVEDKLASLGVGDSAVLGNRVATAFEDSKQLIYEQEGLRPANVPVVLSMGDFWPASVLVDGENHRLGLIGWEFAHTSLPLSDIAQFSAYLNLYSLVYTSIDWLSGFILTFMNSYISHSRQLEAAWLSPTLSRSLLRHAVILHGREMVNIAMERDWGTDSPSRSELVNAGCRYLRLAGDNDGELQVDELSKDTIFGPLCTCL